MFLWWGVRFLSTLSLRRATARSLFSIHFSKFLSTLSLRRATLRVVDGSKSSIISIHALLAESDAAGRFCYLDNIISIHALLAESDLLQKPIAQTGLTFLSTLSLRRATFVLALIVVIGYNFYPRSPCGERRQITRRACVPHIISIHALLAESDPMRRCKGNPQWYFYPRSPCGERR